ncbi:hypothetical protein PUN28_011585 [Cardiocondyla obscurior]|uniref:Uncharacterized protein n=1 Tax=Cardiocondyla obscurior TaxID=286306 RepID=A0AAW2FEP0_9HYME
MASQKTTFCNARSSSSSSARVRSLARSRARDTISRCETHDLARHRDQRGAARAHLSRRERVTGSEKGLRRPEPRAGLRERRARAGLIDAALNAGQQSPWKGQSRCRVSMRRPTVSRLPPPDGCAARLLPGA